MTSQHAAAGITKETSEVETDGRGSKRNITNQDECQIGQILYTAHVGLARENMNGQDE